MDLLALSQTAVETLQKMTTTSDNTAIITSIAQTGIFSFLVVWIYKMFSKMNESLKEEVEDLRKQVKELKANENKWFKKYHALKVLIIQKGCKAQCKIKEALDELLSKEGETE